MSSRPMSRKRRMYRLIDSLPLSGRGESRSVPFTEMRLFHRQTRCPVEVRPTRENSGLLSSRRWEDWWSPIPGSVLSSRWQGSCVLSGCGEAPSTERANRAAADRVRPVEGKGGSRERSLDGHGAEAPEGTDEEDQVAVHRAPR